MTAEVDAPEPLPADSDTEPILQVRELQAGYGDIKAVWDVSFDASVGQVTLLLGRNGAGKTTTLRAICGLSSVFGGSILLGGRNICRTPVHLRSAMGIVFVQEGKRVFVEQTIEDNLLLGSYRKRWSRAERRAACEQAYELFPVLGQRRKQRAGSLSGGQQQMLAIAGALMSRPKVLLLDEPSAGLAPAIVNDVLTVVSSLSKEGLAVVLVEQNAEHALPIADHVLVMDLGRVVLNASPSEADFSTLVRSAYFDTARP
jgi:branched-chain amino acid transport system ATP-binding protein